MKNELARHSCIFILYPDFSTSLKNVLRQTELMSLADEGDWTVRAKLQPTHSRGPIVFLWPSSCAPPLVLLLSAHSLVNV